MDIHIVAYNAATNKEETGVGGDLFISCPTLPPGPDCHLPLPLSGGRSP